MRLMGNSYWQDLKNKNFNLKGYRNNNERMKKCMRIESKRFVPKKRQESNQYGQIEKNK